MTLMAESPRVLSRGEDTVFGRGAELSGLCQGLNLALGIDQVFWRLAKAPKSIAAVAL